MTGESDTTSVDESDTSSSPGEAGLSTRAYLRLTVGNRISLLGVAIGVLGVVYVLLTSPSGPVPGGDPMIGAGLLLGGTLVFALGFSQGQRTLGERDDW